LNVTINRAEMLCAIKRASAIAPADSPLDVLRGVLLEADAAAGKLTVTSTNLEAALEEKLPCTVQEDGALVFGAKMLAEMLSRLPQDTVRITTREADEGFALLDVTAQVQSASTVTERVTLQQTICREGTAVLTDRQNLLLQPGESRTVSFRYDMISLFFFGISFLTRHNTSNYFGRVVKCFVKRIHTNLCNNRRNRFENTAV